MTTNKVFRYKKFSEKRVFKYEKWFKIKKIDEHFVQNQLENNINFIFVRSDLNWKSKSILKQEAKVSSYRKI